MDAIDLLKTSQKTTFILSQIEKLSQKEVAAIMEISEKAVESLNHRAKEKLRIILGKLYQKSKVNL